MKRNYYSNIVVQFGLAKKSSRIFFLVFISFNIVFASDPVIKSLQVFVNNEITSLPVLKLNSNDKLNIYFEVESKSTPSFAIHFKACNLNWEPYNNLLLQGTSDNAQYNIYSERLPSTTEGASYFVSESFPNENVSFNNSGNWMFFITDSYDKDYIYEFGKFYVVEEFINLGVDVQNWRKEGGISSNNELDRVLNLKVNFTISDSLSPFRIEHVEIVKNLEINYPQIITKNQFEKNKGYEWNGSKEFTFITRDLEPGNEYRKINLNDRNKYQYPRTRAHFDGIEYSRFYQLGDRDQNGGFRLMNKANEYADYLVTTFEFKPHEEIDEDIFIVGSFTNWEVLPWYKLDKKDEYYSISLELKRGVYDYQYVSGRIEDEMVEDINWRLFEGNFWETINSYSIFLYYVSAEKGEYHQIIGYKQILR